MRKLTKDQRYYRKKKKEGKKNIIRLPKLDPKHFYERWKVARRSICIRVSLEAFEKLTEMSQSDSVNRWELLSRILNYTISKFEGFYYTDFPTVQFDKASSIKELIDKKPEKIKYKGTKGSKQINYRISSTAWNKLDALHKQSGESKARIVQRLILKYELPTEAVRQQRKKYYEQYRKQIDSWNTERERQGETVNPKKSKFIDVGYNLIHVKGIPAEYWDEAEIDEYNQLMEKKIEEFRHHPLIQEG
jgi:predicted DNA-binding protein